MTQIIGGYLSFRFGGKIVYAFSIGIASFLTVLTPPLTKLSPYALITIRALEGLAEGTIYPCNHAILSKWAPPLERNRMASILYAGGILGNMLAALLGGLLANAFGWPSIFYVFGSFGLLWTLLWCYYVSSGPELDRTISQLELAYITQSLRDVNPTTLNPKHVPWKEILTSVPVWAIIFAVTASIWLYNTISTQLPKFMSGRYTLHRLINFWNIFCYIKFYCS